MTAIRDTFREKSRDLARVVAGHARPLTFVLGAGASLSSGAPPTPKVHASFAEVTKGRFGGKVREHFQDLRLPEVREHLQPMFADVVPDVGYRLMASLGRSRRVYAVVLNWDSAIRQACDEVGTPVECFDPLRNGDLAEKEALLPPGRGVLVVHVHGTIEDHARYGYLETAPTHPAIWASVAPLLKHETIICGASLVGDLDVAYVIQELSSQGREDAATWLFTRPGGDPPPVPIPHDWVRIEDERVDFDDLMIILAEEALAATGQEQTRWDELVDALPHLGLPRTEMLVELKPEVRRRALAARVAGLVAPPFSGKSVGAVRLGHLRRLVDGVEQPLRVSVDPQDSPAELAISAALGDIVVVVDDPFGSDVTETNPRVRDFLLALCKKESGYACVCSPTANWTDEAGRLREEPEGLYTAPGHAGDWYERERLSRLAERLNHKRPAMWRVHARKLVTPPEVLEVGRTGHPVDTARLVEDKRRLLDMDPRLGLLCAIVRLQERSNSPITAAELEAILGCDPDEIQGVDRMLLAQQLEESSFWVINHSTSTAATDSYLGEHLCEVRERLEQAKVLPAWIDRCLAGWALASGRPFTVADDLDPDEGLEPAEWMAQRLGPRPTEQDLAAIEQPRDEWATIDFAYEVARVWDSIEHLKGSDKLLDDLSNRPMGLYGLLEGCLYFGAGAEDALWTNLMHRLHRLPKDPSRRFELLLILDAVMWRAPQHEPLRNWASDTIATLPTDSPEFAIVRFASGYHAAGLAVLDVEDALAADAKHAWTPDQAATGAELVAWHFAHQSRARVLLHRRIDIDKEWLCQSLGQVEPKDDCDLESQLLLINSLADCPETAGWAFHLACNLAVVAGLDLRHERVRASAERALRASKPGDPGVTSATVAYRSADLFARDLRERFRDGVELERLLNAMGEGLEIPGEVVVEPPRFRFVHDPASVYKAIGQSFPQIDPSLPREPVKLAAGLWRGAADILEDKARPVRRRISALIERVGRGDLQPLLGQSRLKEGTGDPYKDAVLRMLEDPSFEEGGLF